MKVLVIHGPNLNMLGMREPEHYGSLTLADIDASIHTLAGELSLEVDCFQSNIEGEIVGRIQQAGQGSTDLIIINPAAFTHTSVAIRDALLAVGTPTIEVHLSNIHKREEFRKHSFVADIAVGQISGFGPESYLLALRAVAQVLKQA